MEPMDFSVGVPFFSHIIQVFSQLASRFCVNQIEMVLLFREDLDVMTPITQHRSLPLCVQILGYDTLRYTAVSCGLYLAAGCLWHCALSRIFISTTTKCNHPGRDRLSIRSYKQRAKENITLRPILRVLSFPQLGFCYT